MGTWNPSNIKVTQQGQILLSKIQAGVGSATITKVMTGAGRVLPEDLSDQVTVSDPQQECIILSKNTHSTGSILNLQVTNELIETPYSINQIGVYASHPDMGEILYMIAQCDEGTEDNIPLPTVTPILMNFNFYILHSAESVINATLSNAGMTPLSDFLALKAELEEARGTELDLNARILAVIDLIPDYQLPKATNTVLGGVKAPTKTSETVPVAVDSDGFLFVPPPAEPPTPYSLPVASPTVLGGVLAKTKTTESVEVSVDETGKLYVPAPADAYVLPQATNTVLGGIKAKERTDESVEASIDTSTGKVYVPNQSYTLLKANNTALGGVKADTKTASQNSVIGIDADGFLFSVNSVLSDATLPTADETYRGKIFIVLGDASTADTIHVCLKDASNAYSWVELTI